MSQEEKTENTYPNSKTLLRIIDMLEEGSAFNKGGGKSAATPSISTKLPKADAEYDNHFASLQINFAEDIKKFVAKEKRTIEESGFTVPKYTHAAKVVDKANKAPSVHGSPSKLHSANTKPSVHGTPSKPPATNVGQIGQMPKPPQHVKDSNDWYQLMATEKMKVQEHQRLMARRDRAVKANDLKQFAESFKLKTEVPRDLLPYLTKDEQKQAEILEKTKMAAKYAVLQAAYSVMWSGDNEARVLGHVTMIQDLPSDNAKYYKDIFKFVYGVSFEEAENLVTYLPMVQIVNMRATLVLCSDLLNAELREHFKFLVHVALCLYKEHDMREDPLFRSEKGRLFARFVAAICKVDLWADKESAASQMWEARGWLAI